MGSSYRREQVVEGLCQCASVRRVDGDGKSVARCSLLSAFSAEETGGPPLPVFCLQTSVSLSMFPCSLVCSLVSLLPSLIACLFIRPTVWALSGVYLEVDSCGPSAFDASRSLTWAACFDLRPAAAANRPGSVCLTLRLYESTAPSMKLCQRHW